MNLKFKDMDRIFNFLMETDDDLGMGSRFPRVYRTVNTEEYDIVPKKSYVKRLIADKEESIKQLEARIEQIRNDISRLKEHT